MCYRIDDNFWRTRMLAEESAFFLGKVAASMDSTSPAAKEVATLVKQLKEAEAAVLKVQDSNTAAAAAQVKGFLPQDFRASLIEMKRHSTERANQKAVDDLIKHGGTIRQKYELFLKQQWERREALVQMGNLSGMYRLFVKYLGGIPQVLLDFAKEINAKVGPMEEQRITYGPDMYRVCTLGVKLDVVCGVWAEVFNYTHVCPQEVLRVLTPATAFFTQHLKRVVEFLGMLFTKSPFFITADEREEAAHQVDRQSATLYYGRVSGERLQSSAGGGAQSHSGDRDKYEEAEEGPQPLCATSLLAAVGLVPHTAGHATGGGGIVSRGSLQRTSHEDRGEAHGGGAPGGVERQSKPSMLTELSLLLHLNPNPRNSNPGIATANTTQRNTTQSGVFADDAAARYTSPARIGPPAPVAPVGSDAVVAGAVVGGGDKAGSVAKWPISRPLSPMTSGPAQMPQQTQTAAAGVGGGDHVMSVQHSGHFSPHAVSASLLNCPRADLTAVSSEFFSVADNTSWVSGVLYQHSIMHDDETYYDIGSGERSSFPSRRSSAAGGLQTQVSGPPQLPTIYSEAGLQPPASDIRSPRGFVLSPTSAAQLMTVGHNDSHTVASSSGIAAALDPQPVTVHTVVVTQEEDNASSTRDGSEHVTVPDHHGNVSDGLSVVKEEPSLAAAAAACNGTNGQAPVTNASGNVSHESARVRKPAAARRSNHQSSIPWCRCWRPQAELVTQ